MGDYQRTNIKISPRQTQVVETDSETELVQQKKESAAVSSGTCQDNSPILVALSIVVITLLIPIGVLANKIKNLNADEPASEM